jgi:photosystem II stability/assembly factor-like uncharacterized protein
VHGPQIHLLWLVALLAAASVLFAPAGATAQTAGEDGWRWFRQSDHRVRRVVASPNVATDHTLLAGVAAGDENGYGVLKSTDDGLSWVPSSNGLDERMRVLDLNLVAAPAPDGTLVLTIIRRTYGAGEKPAGIYVSTDVGKTWVPRLEQSAAWDLLAQAISPTFPSDGIMLLGMRATGVLRSVDGGQSLVQTNTGLTTLYPYGLAFTPTFASDGTIFAATEGGGAFRSTDRGSTWQEVNSGLDELYLYSVATSPDYANDHTVMAGSGQGTVFASRDGALSWLGSGKGINDQRLTILAFSPDYATNHTLYVGSESGGIFRSADAGSTWTRIDTPFGAEVFSIVPLKLPQGEGLIATPSDGGIWLYAPEASNPALAATAAARAAAPTPTPRLASTPVAASGSSGGPAAGAASGEGLQCLVYMVLFPGLLIVARISKPRRTARRTPDPDVLAH